MNNLTKSPFKLYIETYGCQMNELDSELLQKALAQKNLATATDDLAGADIVILNTCSVRDLAEQKVWSFLGRLTRRQKQEQKPLVIAVIGCMAERESANIVRRVPAVDIICGPSYLQHLGAALSERLQHLPEPGHPKPPPVVLVKQAMSPATGTAKLVELPPLERPALTTTTPATPDPLSELQPPAGALSPQQAYVRITRGCNKFCSFCIVPYTRGTEVHREVPDILAEIAQLLATGVQEITLIGQTVNHYTSVYQGKKINFAELLFLIHERFVELPRLRFLTSFPRDFTHDILEVMQQSPRICRYLHLPVQSGSNRLLKLMNRGYTVEEYLALIATAKQLMPDISISSDIITGFPSETLDDHQQTLALLQQVRYKNCFIFKYSPRPGTLAFKKFPEDLPETLKNERNLEILNLQNQISHDLLTAKIGQTLPILVEKKSKDLVNLRLTPTSSSSTSLRLLGRTPGDDLVAFAGTAELMGKIIPLKITGATKLTLLAEHPTNASA